MLKHLHVHTRCRMAGCGCNASRHSYWTRQMWGEASMLHTGWDLGQSLSFMQYTTLAGSTDTCRGYAHHRFVVRRERSSTACICGTLAGQPPFRGSLNTSMG